MMMTRDTVFHAQNVVRMSKMLWKMNVKKNLELDQT